MKCNLRDIDFVIPIMVDSPERLENLMYILDYIKKYFDTHIIVVECAKTPTDAIISYPGIKYVLYRAPEDGIFPRTKVINTGLRLSRNKYFSIYDADVFFEPRQYAEAAILIRTDTFSLVYPYSGKFVDIHREVIKNGNIKEFASFTMNSVGGACFLNRQDYVNAGLESEHITSWGPEDNERLARMIILGHHVAKVEGTCYHITHPRGINSSPSNPHTASNNAEYEKVKKMTKEELLAYIETWEWNKKLVE